MGNNSVKFVRNVRTVNAEIQRYWLIKPGSCGVIYIGL